jgi:hypothetical protein
VTIDILPDDALLEISDWYLGGDEDDLKVDAWYPLVHVNRRWRNIIFSSPRRLNLRLFYTAKPGKPASDVLGVWPSLPIIIQVNASRPWSVPSVIAALEHRDRIRRIQLVDIAATELTVILQEMQGPFPALEDLLLTSSIEEPQLSQIIPDSFLGSIAPRLRSLTLVSIPFQGLPNLISSTANDLVELSLLKIPRRWGYIRPKMMAAVLSALTKLETLSIEFGLNPRRGWTARPPSQLTRFVLPSLKSCRFQGICGYLECFLARIDAPRLENLDITLCKYENHPFPLEEIPQFNQFIGRTKMFKALNNASIYLGSDNLEITLSRIPWAHDAKLTLKIMCRYKIRILARVCITKFLTLSNIERLGISSEYHKWQPNREASAEDIQWVLSLARFSAVKILYLSKEIVPSVACGLKEVTEGRLIPVLGSLQKISTLMPLPLGSVKTEIDRYAASRGLSVPRHPTTPFCWAANEQVADDL